MSIFNTKWLIVAVVFTAAVVFLTHLPQEAIPSPLQESGFDKLAHALAYGAITLLFILSLRSSATVFSASVLFLGILALATLDEFTQPLCNRSASLTDWLANVMGIVMALLYFVCFKSSKRQAPVNVDT